MSDRSKEKKSCMQHFDECYLEPVITEGSSIVIKPQGKDDAYQDELKTIYAATSFYLDGSGRSKMSLPMKFTLPSKEALDDFLANDCIHPVPQNVVPDEEGGGGGGPFFRREESRTSLGFEVRAVAVPIPEDPLDLDAADQSSKSIYSTSSHGSAVQQQQPLMQAPRAVVEGITVISARIDGTSVIFESQVIVRAAAATRQNSALIKTRLHVVAVLSEQPGDPPTQQSRMSYAGFPDFTLQTTLAASKVKQTKLQPFILEVTLTDSLAIDVTSITGPTPGRTLISLVMRHPNTHAEPVTVTNIALHPGHSRLDLPAPPAAAHNHKPATLVSDMSKCVQWGYAPKTQPKLPLTLYPHCAVATILNIDAMEHMRSRTFKSPVSVTAVVGHPTGGQEGAKSSHSASATSPTTISTADAQWTTGRLAQEPSDAFRIDMQLQNKEFYVGEPFTIFLRVKNLSAEARDMMLLVAKDSDKQANSAGTLTTTSSAYTSTALAKPMTNNLNASTNHGPHAGGTRDSISYSQHHPPQQQAQQQQRSNVPNTAVVSEVNGYTFGVWGLIADSGNPVFRLDRDQDLLAIDAALLLGEIKGHHSVEAQLRFNPLREGTLDVPNMQLFDKRNRKWYYCTHKLNIVARQKRTGVVEGLDAPEEEGD